MSRHSHNMNFGGFTNYFEVEILIIMSSINSKLRIVMLKVARLMSCRQ